jgi:predicted ATP-dependent Lon-type protease
MDMTYEAEVQFKFDATFTPTYGTSSWTSDDYIPEEHYKITAPAADLNAKQYFKLFEKFMLCVGMCPQSIRSGAMSLVFNDYVNESDQRKVCAEYELTMDEDLEKKYQEWKERDAQWAKMNAHYEKNFGSEPKIKGDFVDSADGVA